MKFNKCNRCGCFFVTDSDVCPKCQVKDNSEINKLKNFFDETDNLDISVDNISYATGISTKNLHRFLGSKTFADNFFNDSNNIKL